MTFNKLKVFQGKASPNIPRLVINPSNLEGLTPAPKFEEAEENVRQEEDENSQLDRTRSTS